MKLSAYSLTHDMPQDDMLVSVNFLTGKVIVFENEARKRFLQFSKNSWRDDPECEAILHENGILIDELTDEQEVMRELKKRIIDQPDELMLIIFVTEDCNFRCKYCCENHLNIALIKETQDNIIKFLDKNLHKYKKLRVEWFGGEPLLHPSIIDDLSARMLRKCKENRVQYYSTITTNGYFLNADMLTRMRHNNIYSYQVTIDGLKHTHDSQRVLRNGAGTWDKIISNLLDIKQNVKSNLFSIMIRTNITHEIFNYHEEYLNFLRENFASDKRFHFLWKLAEDWGNMDDENKDILCGLEEYRQVVKKANENHLRNRFLRKTISPGGRICEVAKKNSLIIFSDGMVGKCSRKLDLNTTLIGDISQLNINSEQFLSKTITGMQSESCKSCVKAPLCLDSRCPFIDVNNCGYDIDDIGFTLECIAKTDDSCIHIKNFEDHERSRVCYG